MQPTIRKKTQSVKTRNHDQRTPKFHPCTGLSSTLTGTVLLLVNGALQLSDVQLAILLLFSLLADLLLYKRGVQRRRN